MAKQICQFGEEPFPSDKLEIKSVVRNLSNININSFLTDLFDYLSCRVASSCTRI